MHQHEQRFLLFCFEHQGFNDVMFRDMKFLSKLMGTSMLFIPIEGKPKMSVGALPKEALVEAITKELEVPMPLVSQ